MTPFYWALGAASIWGFAPILEKLGLARIDPIAGLFLRCVGVMLGGIVLLIFKFQDIKPALTHPPPGLGWILAGGILASVVGQFCFYHALKSGLTSMAVPVGASYPLIAFVLSILILGEKFSLMKLGGVALVILGVFLLK